MGRRIPRILTALILAASALGLLSTPIGEYDDSILLVGARLVESGKTPYTDFYAHYGPFGYTVLSALTGILGSPGLALRVGQIAMLSGLAILLHLLARALRRDAPVHEIVVPVLVLALSRDAMEPAFFGLSFAVAALVLFVLARVAVRPAPAALLLVAAGAALAAAALTRPGFGAYTGGALLVLEASAGWPRFGALRSPLRTLVVLFGSAALATMLAGWVLYPNISPGLAFQATVITPGRLISAGARFLRPEFLREVGANWKNAFGGAALVATTLAWTFAVVRPRVRLLSGVCIAAGGLLPVLLLRATHPGRYAGLLALILFVLTGLVAFAGRRELSASPLLRASATFGLAAAAFGHYFWARADDPHFIPFLTLALIGALILSASLDAPRRLILVGVCLLSCVLALHAITVPAGKLLERGSAGNLRPWACTVVPADARDAVALADAHADPTSRFVAVGSSQAWSAANPIALFSMSSRLPYTRWFQYDPGVQTSSEVQREMVRELEASGSQTAVVWNAEQYLWDGAVPMREARSPFDDSFDRLYPVRVARFGGYEVRSRGPITAAPDNGLRPVVP
jgi:hypothetical protein